MVLKPSEEEANREVNEINFAIIIIKYYIIIMPIYYSYILCYNLSYMLLL